MALNTGNSSASATSAEATAFTQAGSPGQAATATQQTPTKSSWNFGAGGNIFGAPIGRSIGSEAYNDLKSALIEIYKNANSDSLISILDLDNQNETALAFSCLIVAMRLKDVPNKAAFHVLILEATGDKPTPVVQYHHQKQIELFRVAGDALDDILIAKAKAAVGRAFPQHELRFTDATVVPATFNTKDKAAVYKLALNAGLANGTELSQLVPTFQDLNLSQIPTGQQLVINMTFGSAPVADDVGNLIRSDFQLSFAAQNNQNQNQNRSLNSGGRETRISEVGGFVEMLWAPREPMVNPYMPAQQRLPQKFAARAVITTLSSAHAYTPANMLLAVANMDALALNNNYYQIFRPQMTKELDLRDAGALNIEGNFDNQATGISNILDTKSSSFTTENLGQFLNTLVQPGLMVAVDCPEAGPQAWYTGLYSAAAASGGGAYDIMYKAAQELTAGNFGRYFPNNAQMFVDVGNRVHLGYYTDRNGAQRDIRDIDYLAAANILGANNVHALRQFTETYLNTNISLAERLSDRKRMISSMTNESAVFTGYAQRVTFSATFLDALRKGIQACNLMVRINSPMSGADFNNQRGVASFANAGLLAPTQSFMGFGMAPQHMQNYINMGGYRY
jgi:hypothetical protein